MKAYLFIIGQLSAYYRTLTAKMIWNNCLF